MLIAESELNLGPGGTVTFLTLSSLNNHNNTIDSSQCEQKIDPSNLKIRKKNLFNI